MEFAMNKAAEVIIVGSVAKRREHKIEGAFPLCSSVAVRAASRSDAKSDAF